MVPQIALAVMLVVVIVFGAIAGFIALLIAIATVSYQSFRAAAADPVKSLRYE